MAQRTVFPALLASIASLAGCANDAPTVQPDHQFVNGMWFNGAEFEPRVGSIVDERLAFDIPAAANATDLEGKYVLPPLCEGHNHNLGGSSEGVEETVRAYLEDGVFYAMMPGSFKLYRDAIADKLNTPKSVDVAFANNGVTGSGGHPRGLRESLMDRFGLYSEFTKETLPDKGYFEADTLEQLNEKWALILAERPDFVKAMLYFSEEYEARRDNSEYYGRRGMNPELLPELVRLAHDANLRVAVHVESDADMAAALRAGADIITHLPSYDSNASLSEETIALAAETNAAIVTTMSIAERYEARAPEAYALMLEAQRDNLARLEEAGANLVLGSDNVMDTSRGEAEHLASLGALGNLAILKMWTENCAQTAFPDRQIGRLDGDYEASFLVLEGDPLADLGNTQGIALRVKDGEVLELEQETAPAQ